MVGTRCELAVPCWGGLSVLREEGVLTPTVGKRASTRGAWHLRPSRQEWGIPRAPPDPRPLFPSGFTRSTTSTWFSLLVTLSCFMPRPDQRSGLLLLFLPGHRQLRTVSARPACLSPWEVPAEAEVLSAPRSASLGAAGGRERPPWTGVHSRVRPEGCSWPGAQFVIGGWMRQPPAAGSAAVAEGALGRELLYQVWVRGSQQPPRLSQEGACSRQARPQEPTAGLASSRVFVLTNMYPHALVCPHM